MAGRAGLVVPALLCPCPLGVRIVVLAWYGVEVSVFIMLAGLLGAVCYRLGMVAGGCPLFGWGEECFGALGLAVCPGSCLFDGVVGRAFLVGASALACFCSGFGGLLFCRVNRLLGCVWRGSGVGVPGVLVESS